MLSNLRRVRDDGVPAGTWVYQPVYPRVLDKLNELLGHFQNDNIRMIKKRQSSVTSSSSSDSNKSRKGFSLNSKIAALMMSVQLRETDQYTFKKITQHKSKRVLIIQMITQNQLSEQDTLIQVTD